MNSKKTTEERRALVSRLRTLCLRERVLEGTVTRTRVGNSLRMTVTDKAGGKTRTLFVPAARQEEVARWTANWKEVRALLKGLSELQRAEFRASEGQGSPRSGAATSARGAGPRGSRTARARSRA